MTNIQDLIQSLQRVAEAEARIPQLERELHFEKVRSGEAERHAQALELNIVGYKQEIEALQAKLRSVEAERDDAGFRHLEAEDRLTHSIRSLREARTQIDDILGIVAPTPPAQPASVETVEQAPTTATPVHHQDVAATEPIPSSSPVSSSEANGSAEPKPFMGHEPAAVYQAEKEGQLGDSGDLPRTVPHLEPAKPYAGKKYWEVPYGVSWDAFIAGGGIA